MIVGPQSIRATPGAVSPLPGLPPNFRKSPKFNYSRTYKPLPRNSNHSRTYAIPRVGGVPVFLSDQFSSFLSLLFPLHTKFLPVTLLFPLHTQKHGSGAPVENVGAPTFSYVPENISADDCGLAAVSSPLSRFAASLTQKQGGGAWSYQFKEALGALR